MLIYLMSPRSLSSDFMRLYLQPMWMISMRFSGRV